MAASMQSVRLATKFYKDQRAALHSTPFFQGATHFLVFAYKMGCLARHVKRTEPASKKTKLEKKKSKSFVEKQTRLLSVSADERECVGNMVLLFI